jgi:hypothetical protein
MNKSAKSKDGRKAVGPGQRWLHLPGLVREALYDTVIGAGLACVDEALEAERVALCGERYEHLADRQALRAGHVASSLVLGGRRVAMQRPRARSVEGRELRLPSWREWSARDPLDERALEQMVLGVSTRGYARSLEPLPEAVTVRGVSKSAVSERFVYGTERKLAELMSRDLLDLTRFRRRCWGRRKKEVSNARNASTVRAGVPATDHRAVPRGALGSGAGARVRAVSQRHPQLGEANSAR